MRSAVRAHFRSCDWVTLKSTLLRWISDFNRAASREASFDGGCCAFFRDETSIGSELPFSSDEEDFSGLLCSGLLCSCIGSGMGDPLGKALGVALRSCL